MAAINQKVLAQVFAAARVKMLKDELVVFKCRNSV